MNALPVRASWLVCVALALSVTGCGGGEPSSGGARSGADGSPEVSAENGRPGSPSSGFDADELPLDAKFDPALRGEPFRSDRQALRAFTEAYERGDATELQAVWSRLTAVQRYEAYQAGRSLSEEADMDDYERMLPGDYLLSAENEFELRAAAERERSGEPEPQVAGVPLGEAAIERTDLGTLRGVVVDRQTGEPVEGMEVMVSFAGNALAVLTGDRAKWSAVTASDGSFEVEDIPAGPVTVVGQKLPRYPLVDHKTSVVAYQVNEERIEVQGIQGRLELPIVVTGVVRDARTGEPVEGVHVSAGSFGGGTTDAQGRYAIRELQRGEWTLVARHEHYLESHEPLTADRPGRIDRDISIRPITVGTVAGVAIDRTTGQPLANTTVALAGQTLETDADGRFRLEGVEVGEIALAATADGYRALQESVLLEPRATVETRLELDPITEGRVLGVVTDASTGRALSGVRVQVGPFSVETDERGRFELDDIPRGAASVTARKAVFEPLMQSVEVVANGSVEVALALEPITTGTVTGVVLASDSGEPVAGAEITIASRRATSGADGRFVLEEIGEGTVNVTARKAVFEPGSRSVRVLAADSVVVEIELAPITYGRLGGRVLDAETGRPVAGAEISAGGHLVHSDGAGRFEVARVDAGSLRIGATMHAYHPGGTSVRIEPAGSAEAVIELEPIKIGTIEGFVVDAKTGEPIAGARLTMGGRSLETDARGRFRIDGVEAGSAAVSARHADYADGGASGRLPGAGTLELEIRLDLRREDVTQLEAALDAEGTIDLYGIHFDSGEDQFKPSSLSTLNAVLKVIERAPARSFQISGHTDSDGSDAYNQDLSERRAASVIRWLVDRGIEAGRLRPVGFGESRPAAPNDTASGKALNRRVELSFAG